MSISPDLKGSSFTLSVLHLPNTDISNILHFLQEKVALAPAFFTHAPIVINVEQIHQSFDFTALKQVIQQVGLIPVGITGCHNQQQQKNAAAAGFAVMTSSNPAPQTTVAATEPVIMPSKIIRTPVRSGQQIYAEHSDLIILNHVSAGAEVIADGSIHVYGSLRGRAIAGAKGQKEAHILCQDLQAELISITGYYWLSDQIDSQFWQQKTLIHLQDDTLHLELISL